MKKTISLIVLTYNEEINIRKCLKSVSGLVDEIIIIDSGSTDKTIEISKEFNARFFTHPFVNQAEQFNWALQNAQPTGDWIIRLDADEEILSELKKEIIQKIEEAPENVCGFFIKRRNYFLGKWIRYGGNYPVWLLRIFRNGTAKSEEREMDEHIVLLRGNAQKLKNDFIDNNLKSLDEWKEKHRKYAIREAQTVLLNKEEQNIGFQAAKKRWIKKKIYYRIPPFFRVIIYFIFRYFFLFGFLDGRVGFRFHFLQGFWYRWLVDIEILKQKRRK